MIELLLAAEHLLAAGRLDQAERLFEQVAVADPRNAIAVVGLARVALERGDASAALAAARRALEIDPQEAAARRLVTRLEEAAAPPAAAPATAEVPEASIAAEMPVAAEMPEVTEVTPAPDAAKVPEVNELTEVTVAPEAAPAPVRRSWFARLRRFLLGR